MVDMISGRIKEEKRADIAKSEFVALLEDIPKERFLGLSPDDDVRGADGSRLIIEAVQDGRHVTFVRWTPEHDTANRGLSGLAIYTRLFQETRLGKNERRAEEGARANAHL